MPKAIFVDRDGVIIALKYNPSIKEEQPPQNTSELKFLPEVFDALKNAQKAGYLLFLVSNQPDIAKGKMKMEKFQEIHKRFDEVLKSNEIYFKEYYYCFHHPNGIVSEYSIDCECRKPKPGSLLKAAKDYNVDLLKSWMIGDKDRDIECGHNAGVRTIAIEEPLTEYARKNINPDYRTKNLKEAIEIILKNT